MEKSPVVKFNVELLPMSISSPMFPANWTPLLNFPLPVA